MKPLPIPEAGVADDLATTIGIAIDDLEAEPDARRAVIAAYARMEATLARHGLQTAAERDAARVPAPGPGRARPARARDVG